MKCTTIRIVGGKNSYFKGTETDGTEKKVNLKFMQNRIIFNNSFGKMKIYGM